MPFFFSILQRLFFLFFGQLTKTSLLQKDEFIFLEVLKTKSMENNCNQINEIMNFILGGFSPSTDPSIIFYLF